jgi:hypothetical protein
MPRVLALYFVTYIVFLSNKQSSKNKRHTLLFNYSVMLNHICFLHNIVIDCLNKI